LLFPIEGSSDIDALLSRWIGGTVKTVSIRSRQASYAAARSELCGPFAGLRFEGIQSGDVAVSIESARSDVEPLIWNGDAVVFMRVALTNTELFLAGASRPFDSAAEVTRNIDAASCCTSLVALLLFLEHAGIARWKSPQRWATIVIDDPNLTPRYGFIDFHKLAALVDATQSAVSIAFIPWNFDRTSSDIARLFVTGWPGLSLSVHGCDHTRCEFAVANAAAATQLVHRSLKRMESLSRRTALRYDLVMVFPQGKFSAAAMQALRLSPFVGVVNTELKDHATGRGVRAGELLRPAITCYAGMPLFLRRAATEPIANFALDLLIGKPCLVVAHSEYFEHGMNGAASLIASLDRLIPDLRWTNLEWGITRSVSARTRPDGDMDVRLFSPVARFNGGESLSGVLHVTKIEPLAGAFPHINVNGWIREHSATDGAIAFDMNPCAQDDISVDVELDAPPVALTRQRLGERAKIAVRRHLSEIRDNRIATSTWARKVTAMYRAPSKPH